MTQYKAITKKHPEEKCVEGYYLYDYGHDRHLIARNEYAGNSIDESCDRCLSTVVFYEIDKNTLCRNTGFWDKNGKSIYENDILNKNRSGSHKVNYRVVWDEGKGSWILESSNGSRHSINSKNSRNFVLVTI